MSNLTNLTLDQIIYYNGVSKTVEVENKKVIYSISIAYQSDNFNLLTSKVSLQLKQNKKTILTINLDKLKMIKDNKNSYKDEGLNLAVFKDLINNLSIDDLDQVDQNLYLLCQLVSKFVPIDEDKQEIVLIPKTVFFELVIDTGKELEKLNIKHTLEFSLLYRFALKQFSQSPTNTKTPNTK